MSIHYNRSKSALYLHGNRVFGSADKFNNWMNSKCHAFGDRKPIDQILTIEGIQLVDNEISKVEHGIFG